MTGIVILNVVLVVGVVVAMVGALSWAIVSSMDRAPRLRTRTSSASHRRPVAKVDRTLVRSR